MFLARAFLVVTACLVGFPGSEWPKLSPFEAVRWKESRPEVLLRGRWHEPRSIDGVALDDLLAFCRRAYGDRAQKRFEEDLVQALSEMGHAPSDEVDLVLVDVETRAEVKLDAVPMTYENRQRVWRAAQERRNRDAEVTNVPRVVREHAIIGREHAAIGREHAASGPDAASASPFAFLARMLPLESGLVLSGASARLDLDQLEWLIVERYSYRDLEGVDFEAAFDAVRSGLGDGVDVAAFAVQLAKLLALFGDGHSGVEGVTSFLPRGYGPLLVEETGGRLLALRADRSGFVDGEHPVLLALDGVDVERWIAAAASIEARGAPSSVRRRAIRNLRYVAWLRLELGLEPGSEVELELASLDGKRRRVAKLELAGERPLYGQRISGSHRRLGDDVGYLRLERMDDDREFLDGLVQAMDGFRDTRGIVIDVRGNGGGSRAALLTLLPYFLDAAEEAYVANVAAYRLAPGDAADAPEGYLANRFAFPASSTRWSSGERAAIDALARTFTPEWRLPAGCFSAWHYFVLRRADEPRAYAYSQPVAILLDADGFSATDVFLAAFAGRPRVTLIGQQSGGGSGRALRYGLVHSKLSVRLSSMASFRRDGRRIDGRGIEPDLAVEPAPGDFLGHGDAVLDAALAHLRER